MTSIINDEELQVLFQAIDSRYGLDFQQYEVTSFKRQLTRVLSKYNLPSILVLWRKILVEPGFITDFINEITVGLTELFRNPVLWQQIQDTILPIIIRENNSVNVWHAGCSTGEEVFSMLITAFEAGYLKRTKSRATDINSSFIQTAQLGQYSLDLKQNFIKNYDAFTQNQHGLEFYFKESDDKLIFKDFLKENCQFEQENITQANLDEKFDIIFCRNVLIYFDNNLKNRAIQLFYEKLNPRGYFIIGFYDFLPKEHEEYFKLVYPEFKVFQKI